MRPGTDDDQSVLEALIGDGRPPLVLTGVMLLLSGAFAIFLSVRREFLPHRRGGTVWLQYRGRAARPPQPL